MKYKNIKTGAIIDSSSKIIGDAWVPADEYKPEDVEETETEEPEAVEGTDGEEYAEEEIDLDEMTKDELVKFAKENEIEVNGKHRKDVIIETILQALEEQ